MEQKRIGIIGSGSWATAIAKIVTDNGHPITWWVRQQANIDYFVKRKHNQHYLRNAYFNVQQLSFSTDIQWDVAGAHNGRLISPSISYVTPLSKAIFARLSLAATHVDGNYADTYFSIDSVGSAASGLPQFDADGGWKSYGASLLGGVDLSGDARDGGWGVFGLVMYSRLTGDAKRSPVTSLRGDADQWFLAGGISYTF